MANYLFSHYKGIYRIMCPYDESTNQFSRKTDGGFEDIDCYIKCRNGIQIFYYGSKLLEVYIPGVRRGKNILRVMEENGSGDILMDVHITDGEVYFKFKTKNMPIMEKYLNPIKNCAERSPFSARNLPHSDYKIPSEDLLGYKEITANLPFESIIKLSHISKSYLKSLSTKTNTYEIICSDMKKKMMKPKEYIHSIGKWNEYIEYLKKIFSNER